MSAWPRPEWTKLYTSTANPPRRRYTSHVDRCSTMETGEAARVLASWADPSVGMGIPMCSCSRPAWRARAPRPVAASIGLISSVLRPASDRLDHRFGRGILGDVLAHPALEHIQDARGVVMRREGDHGRAR